MRINNPQLHSLRENCPYSGKYGAEKLRIRILFTQGLILKMSIKLTQRQLSLYLSESPQQPATNVQSTTELFFRAVTFLPVFGFS